MKKLLSLLFATAIVVTAATSAFAVDQGTATDFSDFVNNKATTEVFIQVSEEAAQNLSATIPLKVILAVKNDDTIVAPMNYTLKNTGSVDLKLTHVHVTTTAGHSFVADGGSYTAAKQMSLTLSPNFGTAIDLYDYTTNKEVPLATASDWNVPTGEPLNLNFSGSVFQMGNIITPTAVFSIEYTIAAGVVNK